jgi:hypothetical protein
MYICSSSHLVRKVSVHGGIVKVVDSGKHSESRIPLINGVGTLNLRAVVATRIAL